MYSNKSDKFISRFDELRPVSLKAYEESIGTNEYKAILQEAEGLENYRWSHLNSSFSGVGSAEMLKSIVPIACGLGIDCEWHCLEGNDEFKTISKRLHNILQGVTQEFTFKELLNAYIEINKKNFENYAICSDFTIVHDPQPCPSVIHGTITGKKLWRCHIDTSSADSTLWNYLLPFINNYDGAVFTHKDFVKKGIRIPTYQITPAIDPLSVKNRQRDLRESLEQLEPLFEEHNIDPERPIILAVSRYDIHKNQASIIRAFRKLEQDKIFKSKKPQLIIVGSLAEDDAEGAQMYEIIQQEISNDPNIYALLNIPDNDENIGALMRVAKIFVHISTKEGFGLVVAEAMWQSTPVIGSAVGGIKLQVINGRTGYLVDPMSTSNIATYIKHLLEDDENRAKMGIYAMEHVRENFLIPTLIKKYMRLMKFYLGLDIAYFKLVD